VGKIFVSYRRDDSRALAVAGLVAQLRGHLGEDRVFIDNDLPPGERYPDELRAELDASDVVVAVIHHRWATDFAADRPTDWVRYELSTALRQGKAVFPVLLQGAPQPRRGDVPADVAEVTSLQSTPLRSASYEEDIATLAAAIDIASAPPDLALTVADRTADQPRLPWRTTALRATCWGVLFAVLALRLATAPGRPTWQALMTAAYITLLPMIAITAYTFVLLLAGQRLDAATRRYQERSLKTSARYGWPLYALYGLLLIVIWTALPSPELPWASTPIKVLLTGLVVIGFGYLVQHQVRQVSKLDNDWPPPVTPDTLTFRRAASRLHAKLTANPRTRIDAGLRRQAESVYLALAEVRAELGERARRSRRGWFAAADHENFLPFTVVGLLGEIVLLTVAGLVIRLVSGPAALPAVLLGLAVIGGGVMLAALALMACFLSARRRGRRLVDELHEWDEVLRPLVFPGSQDQRTTAG